MAIVVTSPVTAVLTTATALDDGTVGAPCVAFLSDSTTGVYKSAGATVGVACAGAVAFEFSATALNCHNIHLTNVGNITCKSTGQAIINLNAVTGIAAGADITAVKSIAGIAAGAPITAAASLAMIAGGGTITNCTSVGSTAADMTLKTNSNIQLKVTDTIADGATALLIRARDGATYVLQPVTLGAADSGGTGYRALRVPNAV